MPPTFQAYTSQGDKFVMDYKRLLTPPFSCKAVFKGITTWSEDRAKYNVIIKFTPTYCGDAQQKLSNMKLAPFLWFCKHMESVGMYMVVTDYKAGKCVGITLNEHARQLQEAIKTLHDANYVCGDLWGLNLLITADGLKIVDLDWCGKVGTA